MTTATVEQSNVQTTREVLVKALVQAQGADGVDEPLFRAKIGLNRARKLDAYIAHHKITINQALDGILRRPSTPDDIRGFDGGLPLAVDVIINRAEKLDELAQALAPDASRQALSEHSTLAHLRDELSPLFFRTPVKAFPRTGKGAFVVCPDVAKSADAFGRVDDIGYIIIRKCTNNGGGAQTMAQAELERIALAATFPEARYDGFVLRSPERVLLRCNQALECRKSVLVLLQDGEGREEDMAYLQAICAPSNLHPSLLVFADTTENFTLMQPLIHARVVGVDALTDGQREVFKQANKAFARKFPRGHNGFAV